MQQRYTDILKKLHSGELTQISEHITEEEFTELRTDVNTTLLHIFAKYHTLKLVPPNILTEKNLLITNKNDETVLEAAIEHNCLYQIPKELLHLGILNLEIRSNTKDPTITILHKIAHKKQIKAVPKELITEKNLLIKDKAFSHENIFHITSRTGELEKLPQEMLTESNLLITNKYANNCLHLAAHYGYLTQIPQKILTIKNLAVINQMKENVIHCAGLHDKIAHILPALPHIPWDFLEKSIERVETIKVVQELKYIHQSHQKEWIEKMIPEKLNAKNKSLKQ
jgi:hypothetical protein